MEHYQLLAPPSRAVAHAAARRFKTSSIITAIMFCALLPSAAIAQAQYPERPIRLVIPYGPGGVADVGMRLLGEKMRVQLKQQIVVENRPGAGAIVAAQSVMSAPADGYTIMLVGNHNAISPSLFANLPYDILTDFKPVSITSYFDLLIATRPDPQVNTLAAFIEKARRSEQPLNVGTTTPGSTQHLGAILLAEMAGIKLSVIPYKTSPEIATALLRGDIDAAFDFYSGLSGVISDGKAFVLASAGLERAAYLKDRPTAIESGLLGYIVQSWNGLAVLKGTSPDVITTLNRAINDVIGADEIQQKSALLGMQMKASTPDAVTKRLVEDMAKWSKIIKSSGMPKSN